MNLSFPIIRTSRGSALVLALLLILAVGVLTAGWVIMITTRSDMVEQLTSATQRRIALENSKALAQEFMLETVIPSVSGAAFNLPDASWGGISVPAWGSAPMLSELKVGGVNPFNPGNGDAYTLDFVVTLHDGDENPTRTYKIESRSPILSGTLLSSQTPTLLTSPPPTIIGNLNVTGAAFAWTPSLSMIFTPTSFSVPAGFDSISFANPSGTTLAADNLALPRQTSNPRSGGAALYMSGQFDAIAPSSLAAHSSVQKAISSGGTTVNGSAVDNDNTDGIVCDGAGNVTVTLSSPFLKSIFIPGQISTLTLVGQAAADDSAAIGLPAILIAIDEPATSSRPLTSVALTLHNSRRLDLAIKKDAEPASSLPIQFSTSGAKWHLLLEIENTPIVLTTSGIVTIQGGIRSDRAITLSGGTPKLTLEADPKFLENLATRNAWVESFRQ